MCPCKNCITLPLCKTADLNRLVDKCVLLREYLKVTRVIPHRLLPDGSEKGHTIHSNLNQAVHSFRIRNLKRYIKHTFKPTH